ncbi:adenylyl-sulfate kinase [Pseudomonas sp. EZ-C24]|uniref:adenylyl-sulfate kinase n=1 Tax=Pseudomonas sp. EZ-C24 TaxID=2753617 RepID=UPI0021CF1A6C|nr:adenylyl-sulfate kinase [Pseudomonas sp. EZ-C24]
MESSQVQTVATPPAATPRGHPGAVIWLTGLSGAGKSSLATAPRRTTDRSRLRLLRSRRRRPAHWP